MATIDTITQYVDHAASANPTRGLWFYREAFPSERAPMHALVSVAALVQDSLACGGALQSRDLTARDRVAYVVPSAQAALPLLLGALRAGLVAMPIAAPATAAERDAYPAQLDALLRETGASLLVIPDALRALAPAGRDATRVVSLEALRAERTELRPARVAAHEPALLQARLGAAQQGARILSHGALIEGLGRAASTLGLVDDDVLVSWLPATSEAGLLALLLSATHGRAGAFLSPVQFLKRPARWLQLLSDVGGTVSCAPEDAYAYSARRIGDDELARLDLSSWRVAGASEGEISARTRAQFGARFASVGFASSAFASPAAASAALSLPEGSAEEDPSEGQKALWFLAQLTPESIAYNVPLCFRIRSPLSVPALRGALSRIVARHAALRTVFPAHRGRPRRQILAAPPLAFEEIDASGLDQQALRRRIAEALARPFDLQEGPLFVARLYRVSETDSVLLLVAHHINVDALSFLVIGAELSTLYGPLAAGIENVALPAPEHDYGAFVRHQAELLGGAEGRRQARYWSAQLAGAPAALALPTDRPRPERQRHQGASVPVVVPDALAEALRGIAEQHGATLYTVMLAVFHALLHRRSAQADLVVATPVAGRSGATFHDVVGYFVNTLPLRARIDADTTFGALVVQTREAVTGALDHADLPFARIVEQANVPRDPSRAPLCQVMFQLQTHRPREGVADVMRATASGAAARLGTLVIEPVELERRIAQFELLLDLTDFGAGITGFCEYDTDLFDRDTVVGLVSDYLALATELTEAPARLVTRVQPRGSISAAERARVLEAFNATDVRYDDGRVHRAIAAQAARTPDAVALSFGEAERSYAELDAQATALARALRALGAGRDVLVGVAMDRSLELVTVLLAVMKAGAAYVPLDPSLPPERLRFMRDDAEAKLAVVDPAHRALLEGGTARVLTVAELSRQAETIAACDEALPDQVAPEDLAYVIYTSGSTGTPKGVGNTHAGLWNRLCWMQDALAIDAGDVVLQKTPYSFDVSVWELFWPLMVGARLAIARPLGHKDSSYLLDEIARRSVTTLHFVPSMLAAFLHEPDLTAARGLKQVVCSGEALSYALMTRFFERLPGVSLHNLYGPTEAAIDVTAWTCEPDPAEAASGASVPIGRPIANTQIYLLDEAREPVAVGEVGELYIGGVQVARGYHRRPALTAERFVRDPFRADPAARLYRTGDLARHREDGLIEYLGRNDDQVKLRGFRIELGEIEGAHPAVRESVVAARKLASGSTRLEAFVVAQPGATLELAALTPWLGARLPEYMVPAAVTMVDAIPLTHSGKADRRALLAHAPDLRDAQASRVAPRGDAELALAAAFRAVLGVDDVSIHDNYFALGGDSIRSLEVRALAKRAGFDFEVLDLLHHQTISALAPRTRAVTECVDEPEIAPFALVRASERASLAELEDAYPATQLQLGMLYHSELTTSSWAYHDVMSFEVAFTTPWQESAMRAALAQVMARHPVLRAAFDVASYARPLQVVHREVAPPLETRDLSRLDAEAAAHAITDYVAAAKLRGYALDRAPLFRVMVHVLEPARVRLTLSFHHAILDGWSTATFLRELLSEYLRGVSTPGAEGLPHFAAPRHRFSALVAEELAALDSDTARAFWATRLADSEVVRLPRWPTSHRRAEPGSARLMVELDAALSARLGSVAEAQGVPLKALLLAGHVSMLAAFTGTDDVLTGRVVHGRPELDGAERILGLFLNTVPLRISIADASWSTLIAAIVGDEQAVHPHRHFPLREIQRVAGQPLLFETAFNFVHFHLYESLIAGGLVDVRAYEAHENTTFGLMVNVVLSPQTGRLSLQLEYDAQQVADEQAAQLARAYVLALEALARDPGAKVTDATLVDDEERARVRSFQGETALLDDAPVHQMFERQVARTPHAVAVVHAQTSLSYAALDGLANGVAARLHEAGVTPGSVVGVCAEPSCERALAVLGVLKAGCAYLPLDPEYPIERLAFMLQDAGVRVVLATDAHAHDAFLEESTVIALDAGNMTPLPVAPSLSEPVGSGDAAYVIYTSGSTGQPKGIVMPHAPLANLTAWQVGESGLGVEARTAHFSAFSFDVAFQELLSTWASGGTLVVVPEACRRDARALAKLLVAERVARLFVPVVMLHQLAEITEQLDLTLPALREIDTAGEQLEITEPVRRLFARNPECRLCNHYGPSETHVATAHALTGDAARWPQLPPIGRPLPGARAYVLDARGRPVPIGVVGELYLGGACVARGYAGLPALTAERFLRDPFAERADARMYRTGDLVQLLPNGSLAYLGRRDGQVKVRGYRVELSEVEAVIMARCGDRLRRAAVVTVPSRSRATRWELAAYLVPRDGVRLDLAQVRGELARALPAHMRPSSLTVCEALPLTPSGKLDRRALPAPSAGEPRAAVRVVPESPLEVALCGLFREVLGVAELGVTDDFFARGGDSLSAVRLMARVERRYGVALPIATLLAEPTVRALARVLAHEDTPREASSLVPLSRPEGKDRPPVFCVHPVGGNVLCYVALARHLGSDQPFYGLSARGLDGRAPPHTSVVEMAGAYASEIVAAQPYGKVHLAGWSFGGIVAVEIARQLHAAGRDVAPVVVMDTIASVRFQVQPSEDDLFECVAMEMFGAELDEGGFEEILTRDAALTQADRFARLTDSARARGLLPDGADPAALEHVFGVIHSNIRAAYDHVPHPFAGEIVLLRCLDAMPARLQRLHDMVGSAHDDAQNGWGALCQKLRVVPVRGDHLTIVFEPHVSQVATILRRIVDASIQQVAAE